ncbi:MAG: hypothetical protein O7D96_03475 [SAR324 cluster bacterium]|nr:hypothetical protein [SAR324 cluster bacterium]
MAPQLKRAAAALKSGMLVALVPVAMAACTNSFLNDFPEYGPTQPFLDEQERIQRRLDAARSGSAQKQREAIEAARARHLEAWLAIERRKDRIRRIGQQRLRLRDGNPQRVDNTRLREWQRIVR